MRKQFKKLAAITVTICALLAVAGAGTFATLNNTKEKVSWDSLIRDIEATPTTSGKASAPYERETSFGQAWLDVDHNGCDTRNDILARDLQDVVFKPGTQGCVVLSGVLRPDPYTGEVIDFVRGEGACREIEGTWNGTPIVYQRIDPTAKGGCSVAIQIDHIVPLSLAWRTGAQTWDQEKREAFANDPENLLAVDGAINQLKSASGPNRWLPEDDELACIYSARYAHIVTKYSLGLTASDKRALLATMSSCETTGHVNLPESTQHSDIRRFISSHSFPLAAVAAATCTAILAFFVHHRRK